MILGPFRFWIAQWKLSQSFLPTDYKSTSCDLFIKINMVSSIQGLYKIVLLGLLNTFTFVITLRKNLPFLRFTLRKHLTRLSMRQGWAWGYDTGHVDQRFWTQLNEMDENDFLYLALLRFFSMEHLEKPFIVLAAYFLQYADKKFSNYPICTLKLSLS